MKHNNMKHKRTLLSLALSVAAMSTVLVQSAHAEEVGLTTSYFKFSSIRYFRGKAENVSLGSYGPKKEPITSTNYLSVDGRITASLLDSKAKIQVAKPVEVHWNQYTKATVEADKKVMAFGIRAEKAHEVGFVDLDTANLRLVKLYSDNGNMKATLNASKGAINSLRINGSDGRVVSELWVVMEADLASFFAAAGSIEVKASGSPGGVKVKANESKSVATSKSYTIELSPGSTFAYLLVKVKKWNDKSQTRVEQTEDDMSGLN
jgi:hypothetical protein